MDLQSILLIIQLHEKLVTLRKLFTMPIYMDRHDLPDAITPEILAELHQKDLKIEKQFDCHGFTYWLDLDRKYAFCLIEAPNEEAVLKMHNASHGNLPAKIIEVDPRIVGSFLGRISDPEKSKNVDLNIINDPAFRIIMIIETGSYLNKAEANQFDIFIQKLHNSISKTLKHYEGRVVKRDNTSYLISFKSVTNAILCALKIKANINYLIPKFESTFKNLKIGMASGIPVEDNRDNIFEEATNLATRLCEVVKDTIVITHEIKALYESENQNAYIDNELIRTLNPSEIKFLNSLMDNIEKKWKDSNFNIDNLSKALGLSKSQLYRKFIQVTGKSPNSFIKDYRLNMAIELLHSQKGNISEVAFETGFNSLAYFSKCFKKRFGLLPSKYIQQHIF